MHPCNVISATKTLEKVSLIKLRNIIYEWFPKMPKKISKRFRCKDYVYVKNDEVGEVCSTHGSLEKCKILVEKSRGQKISRGRIVLLFAAGDFSQSKYKCL
jgi:hypothetical protein